MTAASGPRVRLVQGSGSPPSGPQKIRRFKFREDDSVVLKNGDQVMEIEGQGWDDKGQWADTVWHDGAGVAQRDRFRAKNLRRLAKTDIVEVK